MLACFHPRFKNAGRSSAFLVILVIGHWSLVIGHWSLVIGHWSLVIGHWSLATNLKTTDKGQLTTDN